MLILITFNILSKFESHMTTLHALSLEINMIKKCDWDSHGTAVVMHKIIGWSRAERQHYSTAHRFLTSTEVSEKKDNQCIFICSLCTHHYSLCQCKQPSGNDNAAAAAAATCCLYISPSSHSLLLSAGAAWKISMFVQAQASISTFGSSPINSSQQ